MQSHDRSIETKWLPLLCFKVRAVQFQGVWGRKATVLLAFGGWVNLFRLGPCFVAEVRVKG